MKNVVFRDVALCGCCKKTDVSEERITSVFREEKSADEEKRFYSPPDFPFLKLFLDSCGSVDVGRPLIRTRVCTYSCWASPTLLSWV
jgi:hypothetical protein